MNVDVTDKQALRALAESERRMTRRVEVINLCDALIHFIALGNQTVKPGQHLDEADQCPKCAARRRRDTQRQQKWRSCKINISGN